MLKSNYSPGKDLTTSVKAKKKSIKKVMADGGPKSPCGKMAFSRTSYTPHGNESGRDF